MALSIVGIILIIAGVLYYQSQVAPFRKPVLTVDNTGISMGYFLKRAMMTGGDPAVVLEQLSYEQIVREMAPEYGITVSQVEVEQTLRSNAAKSKSNVNTANVTAQMTDSAFEEWYSEQLKITGLSDAEYRELIRTNLVAGRLQTYLADQIPSRGEQVYLHVIVLGTSEDALKAKARIKEGETFATVASEVSLDATTKVSGGTIGWMPRGVIPYDDIVFQLNVGQVSDPVLLNVSASGIRQYAIFMVSQKDPDRQIEDNMLRMLRSMALYNWLRKEIPQHKVEYDFDEEAQDWVSLQIAELSKE